MNNQTLQHVVLRHGEAGEAPSRYNQVHTIDDLKRVLDHCEWEDTFFRFDQIGRIRELCVLRYTGAANVGLTSDGPTDFVLVIRTVDQAIITCYPISRRKLQRFRAKRLAGVEVMPATRPGED